MKRAFRSIVVIVFFGSVPIVLAQMRGGSSGGMGSSQSSGGGMGGQHSAGMGTNGGMDQGGPMLSSEQRRQMMHTTKTQDNKYAICAQAMNKVRGTIKHSMSGANTAQGAEAQQPDGGNDQLDSDVQDLEQDQSDFLDSLSDEQKSALENQIKDLQKKMKQLDALSKELNAELEDKNTDPKKIREQTKKLDKLSKAIQNEQRQIAGALGIQS